MIIRPREDYAPCPVCGHRVDEVVVQAQSPDELWYESGIVEQPRRFYLQPCGHQVGTVREQWVRVVEYDQ